ncbi:MAG: tetrahydromethanopterin S-methyltransferase subunit A [Candidatus Aenigmatarchaeota archaeon]
MNLDEWPIEAGRYKVGNKQSCIAVCTLSSLDIELPMDNIAIVGKCVTENVGMEKMIKNIISNPHIRYLVICGQEPKGHYVGQAFKCLIENGLDSGRRIIGAKGAMPLIKNVSDEQLEHFKRQIEIIDVIEEEDRQKIMDKINSLEKCDAFVERADASNVETLVANYNAGHDATADKGMDDCFFTILIDREKHYIIAEYYLNRKLEKKIIGRNAEEIIGTIARLRLVKGLYHMGYLGKELKKAEIALRLGIDYEQDKVLEF